MLVVFISQGMELATAAMSMVLFISDATLKTISDVWTSDLHPPTADCQHIIFRVFFLMAVNYRGRQLLIRLRRLERSTSRWT